MFFVGYFQGRVKYFEVEISTGPESLFSPNYYSALLIFKLYMSTRGFFFLSPSLGFLIFDETNIGHWIDTVIDSAGNNYQIAQNNNFDWNNCDSLPEVRTRQFASDAARNRLSQL